MNKFLTTVMCALVFGLVFKIQACSQSYTFDIPANPPSGATGSYHAVFTVTGATSFDLTFTGNPDGNTADNFPMAGLPMKHDVFAIGLQFLDASANTVNVLGGTGGIPGPGNWTVGGGGSYVALAAPGPTLDAFGANTFHGSVNIANASFKTVNIGLQDGAEQWFLPTAVITPEASSIALLMPGCMPLAWMYLKRRRG